MKQPRPSPAKQQVSWRTAILVGVLVLAVFLYLIIRSSPLASNSAAKLANAEQKTVTLAMLDGNVEPVALQPLASKWDPEGYAKLGKAVWGRSNEYRRWAALAALQSDKCRSVGAISVWERATRSQLAWHVVCGEERSIVSEEQALGVRARLDPDAPYADRLHYAEANVPRPMSAVFAEFQIDEAVLVCENAMREASVDQGSFETSGSWDEAHDEEAGQAVIMRDYSSKNALGGTISGRYRCVVSAVNGNIASLQTKHAFGVHTVL